MRSKRLFTLGCVALVLLVGSCGGDEADPSARDQETTTTSAVAQPDEAPDSAEGRWVGKVDGTDAFVAIVSNGEATTVYVCDGASIDAWFTTDAGDTIQAESNDITLAATRDGGEWTGTVSIPGGSTQDFDAAPSEDDVLYRADGEDDGTSWLGGWIVLDDEQRGTLVLRTATTSTQTAPTLDPASLTLSDTATTSLVVQPVTPLRLPTGSIAVTNAWTASGRVTRSGAGVGGVTVRFTRSDGSAIGSARTSADGSYRLTMAVPSAPIVATVAVLDGSGRTLRVSSPAQVTTVPNGASVVNVALA